MSETLGSTESGAKRIRVPGMGSLLLRSKTWWVCYYVNGVEHRESARQPDEGFRDGSLTDAKKLLKKRMGEQHSGQYVPPDAKRLTVGELRDLYLAHYERKGLRSKETAAYRFRNLVRVLGGDTRAVHLTTPRLLAYQDTRREEKAEAATINRETAALHRAFTLARKANLIKSSMIPEFPDRLEENPPRQGFLEHGNYLAIRNHLPDDHRDVFDCTYWSGWRKEEVHSLPWRMVDLGANVLRLDPAFSKSKEGRVIPIPPPLRDVLERRMSKRRLDCPLVFHREGRPMGDWRKTWKRACRAAGMPNLLLHDCRRTAARNLDRAGVRRPAAMALLGHKTEAMYRRYNIVSEQDLHEAGQKLAAYVSSLDPRPSVIALSR